MWGSEDGIHSPSASTEAVDEDIGQICCGTVEVRHLGILNYFEHPITTGMVEGINNKIKVLKRKVYGYRDMEYFLLRIYFIHEAKYTLTG